MESFKTSPEKSPRKASFRKLFFLVFTPLFLVSFFSQGGTLDDLLKKVQTEGALQSVELAKREAQFLAKKNKQQKLLNQAKAELSVLEKETAQLMLNFNKNEKELGRIEEELNITMGHLGEMFGVVRQVAGDFKGQLENSLVSAQLPGRKDFLGKLAESQSLPNIPQLEKLWFELQNEMTQTGKTLRFKAHVVQTNGDKKEQRVTRVGAFNLVSEGQYLNYQPTTGQIMELSRQPSSRFTGHIDDLEEAKGGYEAFAIDPSRGSLLSTLVRAPRLMERIHQGGLVGAIIILVFLLGLGLVAERIKTLKTEGDKIKAQMKNQTPCDDNALGLIMLAYKAHQKADLETLELKMEEAILKSTPSLEKRIGTLKILAAMAPLLGLLGTVTGMIATFQSITLFGTGDPRLMAGGISQALVTTVLGLICAITLLLLHTLVANQSKALVQILEEEAVGMMATRGETEGQRSK